MARPLGILCLIHQRIDGEPSGTPLHLLDLVHARPEVRFGVCYTEAGCFRLDVFHGGAKDAYAWPLPEATQSNGLLAARDRAILECALEIVRPALIHIHHLQGHSLAVYPLAKAFGLPLIQTLHDFHSVCPRCHFADAAGVFCHFNREEVRCRQCLAADKRILDFSAAAWRARMGEALREAALLTAPSEFVFRTLESFVPLPRERCRVLPLGLPEALLRQRVRRSARAASARDLRAAVLGPLKLSAAWLEELRAAPAGLELHYFGHVPFPLPEGGPVVHRSHGIYARERIVELLAREELDLAILPARVPETFCLALSEAWCAGLPVLVPDQGALGERLRAGGGWLYDPAEVAAAGRKLRELAEQPAALVEEMARVAALPLPSAAETAEHYAELWRQVATP